MLHEGGNAPIPCPSIEAASLPEDIGISWNEAANLTVRDGASAGVTGYRLFWEKNPTGAPTDTDWASVTDYVDVNDRTITSETLSRDAFALKDGDSLVTAIKLKYPGSVVSTNFSCNSNISIYSTIDSLLATTEALLGKIEYLIDEELLKKGQANGPLTSAAERLEKPRQ